MLVTWAAPAASSSCWTAPIPPPMSITVAPSTPSVLSASISILVDGIGPLLRKLRSSDAAFLAL